MQPPNSPPPQLGATETIAAAAFTADVVGLTLGKFGSIKGLEAQVDILEYREGGINDIVHRLPGQLTYPNLVLSGGQTTDAVEKWFAQTRLGGARHAITVTLLDNEGNAVRAWSFADAFPVRWTGPTLAAGTTEVAGEELEIAHGGMKVVKL
jgi:phage tail-like protein